MTSCSSSREELRASLTDYLTYLQAKNETLTELSHASTSMLIMLKNDLPDGMDKLLNEREQQCKRLMSLCKKDIWRHSGITDYIEKLARGNSDELSQLARELLALRSRAQLLGDKILKSQKECETIMRSQLDATSGALRSSVQRRKLDAAYGPVSNHCSPAFLDRQR